MISNNKINYLGLMFLALTIFSCKKYLDEAPDTLYAYPDTVENLQAILDNPKVMNFAVTPSYAEASADDYFVTESVYNSLYQTNKQAYLWETPFPSEPDWRVVYSPIYVANIALEGIDKISKTPGNLMAWNNVKGSAYFYRAYYFLHILWTYANAYNESTADAELGIVLRKTTDINEPSFRSTVKESYLQVIDDAKQAIQFLPDLPTHSLKPSKAAAYALLARVYLSMRDYENARMYSELCLQIKRDLMNYNENVAIVTNSNPNNPPFSKYNTETIFYSESSYSYEIFLPRNAFIDSFLINQYDENDLRKRAYFFEASPYKKFRGSYSQTIDVMFSGIATDEIYLIRAECNARKGDKDAALSDLNTLLKTRWKSQSFNPVTAVTIKDALDKILLERRKELLMRDLRWMDIKRRNKEEANISIKRILGSQAYTLPANDKRFALPLPNDIIQITGMPQNPR